MKYSLIFCLSVLSAQFAFPLSITTFNLENFGSKGFFENEHQVRSDVVRELSKLKSDLIILQEVGSPNTLLTELFISPYYSTAKYSIAFSNYGGGGKQRLAFMYKKNRLELIRKREDFALTQTYPTSNTRAKKRICHYNQSQTDIDAGRKPGPDEIETEQEIFGFTDYRGNKIDKCGSSRPAFIGYFHDKKTGEDITAIAVHLKSGGREKSIKQRDFQFETLSKIMNEERMITDNIVIGGDFNTTEFIDRSSSEYRKHINYAMMNGMTYVDNTTDNEKIRCSAYWDGGNEEELRPNGRKNAMTYYAGFLDHILVTEEFESNYGFFNSTVGGHCAITQCNALVTRNMLSLINKNTGKIISDTFKTVSDHCPVSAHFLK